MSGTFREFAERILAGRTLEEKLVPPPPAGLRDVDRGTPRFWEAPIRPPELVIARQRERIAMPDPRNLHTEELLARTLHVLANHELQAVELFAFALAAYPDAPPSFRRGVLAILAEEQIHVRLYLARLAAHGATLGDYPVNGYFWGKASGLYTPLHFVSAMSLTFEGRNLDHSLEYEAAFRSAGVPEDAALMRRIHEDEIGHVRFGWTWLTRLRDPRQDGWRSWVEHLVWPLTPAKARGRSFDREARLRAGIPADVVDRLAAFEA